MHRAKNGYCGESVRYYLELWHVRARHRLQVDAFAGLPVETVLHRFNGGSDGDLLLAGVIRDNAGNLYGTTAAGGAKRGPA